ncbi:hypothetical protein Efla_006839 [Eimeria flavescens]
MISLLLLAALAAAAEAAGDTWWPLSGSPHKVGIQRFILPVQRCRVQQQQQVAAAAAAAETAAAAAAEPVAAATAAAAAAAAREAADLTMRQGSRAVSGWVATPSLGHSSSSGTEGSTRCSSSSNAETIGLLPAAAVAEGEAGSSSTDNAAPHASRMRRRLQQLFKHSKLSNKNDRQQQQQPQQQPQQQNQQHAATVYVGGVGELRRRLLRQRKEETPKPMTKGTAAEAELAAAGSKEEIPDYPLKSCCSCSGSGSSAEDSRKSAVSSSSSLKSRGDSQQQQQEGSLSASRSVRFGTAEVWEFSPTREVHSSGSSPLLRSLLRPRSAAPAVAIAVIPEEEEEEEEEGAAGSKPQRTHAAADRESPADDDADILPHSLQDDLAAAAASPAEAEAAGGEASLPEGLTLDHAITFGHGQFASRAFSHPVKDDSEAVDAFLKTTEASAAAAEAARYQQQQQQPYFQQHQGGILLHQEQREQQQQRQLQQQQQLQQHQQMHACSSSSSSSTCCALYRR